MKREIVRTAAEYRQRQNMGVCHECGTEKVSVGWKEESKWWSLFSEEYSYYECRCGAKWRYKVESELRPIKTLFFLSFILDIIAMFFIEVEHPMDYFVFFTIIGLFIGMLVVLAYMLYETCKY